MGRQREVQMRCWWDAGGRGAAVTPALNSLHSYLPQVEPCCCAVRVAVPWCALLMLLLSPQTCSKAQTEICAALPVWGCLQIPCQSPELQHQSVEPYFAFIC